MEDKELYQQKLGEYKKSWREIRTLERKGDVSLEYIHVLDQERDAIHKELRVIAPRIGKNEGDVDLDILANEENLREYGLPEFSIKRISDYNKSNSINFNSGISVEFTDKDGKKHLGSELSGVDVFIAFGVQPTWHLFDHQSFFQKFPDDLERRRRAKTIADGFSDVLELEIYDQESFHRGMNFFGIAIPNDKFEKVLAFMRENRKEISIDERYFDRTRLDEDFEVIVRQDMEEILAYEPGKHEDHKYLVERYLDTLPLYLSGKEAQAYLETADTICKETLRRIETDEIDRELQKEEKLAEQYPVSHEPKQEGFGRK
ncbi:MAG: hypothetical protein V1848_01955 [Candidatus Magasanikbacteria bacterium]